MSNVRTALEMLRSRIDGDPALADIVEKVEQIEAILGTSLDGENDRVRLPYSSDPPSNSERWKLPQDA